MLQQYTVVALSIDANRCVWNYVSRDIAFETKLSVRIPPHLNPFFGHIKYTSNMAA